jgi:hypothetical protein
VAAVLAAIYSASQDESATTFCLRACQLTKLLPWRTERRMYSSKC